MNAVVETITTLSDIELAGRGRRDETREHLERWILAIVILIFVVLTALVVYVCMYRSRRREESVESRMGRATLQDHVMGKLNRGY